MSTSWDIACVACSKAREGDGARFSVGTCLNDCRHPDHLTALLEEREALEKFGECRLRLQAASNWIDWSMERNALDDVAVFFADHLGHEMVVANEYGQTKAESDAQHAEWERERKAKESGR